LHNFRINPVSAFICFLIEKEPTPDEDINRKKGVYQILGINDTHPVVDRSKTGGKNVLPIDYLCAAYHVEDTGVVLKPVQCLDLIIARKNKLVLVKAFNNGVKAADGTKIRVFNPENWRKNCQ